MTKNIEIGPIGNPLELYDEFTDIVNDVGATAFGRPYDEFAEDVRDHFQGSTHGHLIRVDGAIKGFSLYSMLPERGLYLEGIAVAHDAQGLGLGSTALKAAIHEFGSDYIAATTRNPATVKLMGGVSAYASPDIRLEDPLQHHRDEKIQKVLTTLAESRFKLTDLSTLPFLVDKYPPGLYGDDPGIDMPLAEIATGHRNAVVVVGIINDRVEEAAA